MTNVLNDIVMRTLERIDAKKKIMPTDRIAEIAKGYGRSVSFPFERALKGDDIAFICEIKKASPSKGIIAEDLDHRRTAMEYHAAGAAAISVLTEPFFFHGNDDHLREVANTVPIPVLRKDFVVDEYMIYEAKILGADAVLLICAILDDDLLIRCVNIAHKLGLSALVEVHDENEVSSALDAGARIIGVNNRDLRTFGTDIGISGRLRPLIPKDKIFVSESGIRTAEDVNELRKMGADAVLIGETLMKSPDKIKKLKELRGDIIG